MEDHVHMMLSFKPKYSAMDVVKNLKVLRKDLFHKPSGDQKSQRCVIGNCGHAAITCIQNQYTK